MGRDDKPFTLMVMLQSLYGYAVKLELKNEQIVHGKVEEVTQNLK